MKINDMYLFLSILFMMSCSGKTNHYSHTAPVENRELLKKSEMEFVKAHSLKMRDDSIIGDVFVRYINDSVFTDLYVVNGYDTLYSIKRSSFQNRKGKDIDVFSDGFYGYSFVLKKNDYFVLSYLRNNGKNVSDDITIEWNYDKSILELQRPP